MIKCPGDDIFGGYCYGPADVKAVSRTENTLKLILQDSSGKESLAAYRDCVYAGIDGKKTGVHFSLVKKITAEEFLSNNENTLYENSSEGENILKGWENAGYNFYMHIGMNSDDDYLIVAKNLSYTVKE